MRTRSQVLAPAVLVLAGALTACGGSDAKDSKASPEPTRATTTATPDVKDGVGADADPALVKLVCAPDKDGVWSARMTLVNSTDERAGYLARVAVLTTATSDVLGRQTLRVELGPGERAVVPFDRLAEGGKEGRSCEPRVVRMDD
ncbi:hypothetical protein [Aeromicrobium yanjiei]|uniref:Secreted protein n=1 Tax=Aeromicrobium yanjiei TaxID=2662028 RepID=A0A5Q2MBU7_9ACTN|nr:hypothetical protein [Aeromicrobium yanjiei]QGG40038.1 hypothetical protein GEV26_00830 [Aeromicrobium yanjiei]